MKLYRAKQATKAENGSETTNTTTISKPKQKNKQQVIKTTMESKPKKKK